MRILLTNDDGLRAPGIQALYEALVDAHGEFAASGEGGGPLGEVTAIAPLTVQSATSHGVTFHEPLMIQQDRLGWGGDESMTGTAVDGRPADCVKLAIASLWPERFGAGTRPDLLISGMNAGANVGINVIYSGTVAAALEGAFLGIPSIAVSLHIGPGGTGKTDFRAGARHARARQQRGQQRRFLWGTTEARGFRVWRSHEQRRLAARCAPAPYSRVAAKAGGGPDRAPDDLQRPQYPESVRASQRAGRGCLCSSHVRQNGRCVHSRSARVTLASRRRPARGRRSGG